MLDVFKWNIYCYSGIENIDRHNKYFVDLTNKYINCLKSNISKDDIIEFLDELTIYADLSFKEEEILMCEVGVHQAHIKKHIQEHNYFMEEVVYMRASVCKEKTKIEEHLLHFLVHWISYHVFGLDESMTKQLIAIRSGSSSIVAYEKFKMHTTTSILVDALGTLFYQMSELNQELYKLNLFIEKKVDEKTKELSRLNKELRVLSLTDSLTLLPNRRNAMKTLDRLWRDRVHSLVCIMIDLDFFKQVNDAYGHEAGDLVLVELAKALKHHFRNDDIVCRLGGDEFLVICPRIGLEEGLYIAESVRNSVLHMSLSTPYESIFGTISLGVAKRKKNMKTYKDLIRVADQSLYLAKESGRNRVCSVQNI
ncbi:diguanylate cyclase [Vibrio parahaemolyticus]